MHVWQQSGVYRHVLNQTTECMCVHVCVQACMHVCVHLSACLFVRYSIFHLLKIQQADVHEICLFWLSLNSYKLLLNIQDYNISAYFQMSK